MTPGAPGGLGVREAVLVTLLTGAVLGPSESLLVAVLLRAVTIAGDLLFFLTSLPFRAPDAA